MSFPIGTLVFRAGTIRISPVPGRALIPLGNLPGADSVSQTLRASDDGSVVGIGDGVNGTAARRWRHIPD